MLWVELQEQEKLVLLLSAARRSRNRKSALLWVELQEQEELVHFLSVDLAEQPERRQRQLTLTATAARLGGRTTTARHGSRTGMRSSLS